MSDVRLVGIEKSFGESAIVKGVDLAVTPGEFLVMVGPSGCGKTTLLRIIAGLEQADVGDVVIGGKNMNDVPPRERDVGMVFQSYALYPHMTVKENMAFGLELRKLPRPEIESRVAEAARMLELGALLERKPKALSGGQRQRVAMGRVVVRRPQLFHAPTLFGFGGELFDATGHAQFDTPAMTKSLAWVRSLQDRKYMPQEVSGALVKTLFNDNRAAMVISGPWFTGEINPGVPYSIHPLPIVSETGLPWRRSSAWRRRSSRHAPQSQRRLRRSPDFSRWVKRPWPA